MKSYMLQTIRPDDSGRQVTTYIPSSQFVSIANQLKVIGCFTLDDLRSSVFQAGRESTRLIEQLQRIDADKHVSALIRLLRLGRGLLITRSERDAECHKHAIPDRQPAPTPDYRDVDIYRPHGESVPCK